MRYLIWYYVLLNFVLLMMMGWDKLCAIKHLNRIREAYLLGLGFLGGALGGLAGMYIFHHKTRHYYFAVGYIAFFLIHLSLCYCLHVWGILI